MKFRTTLFAATLLAAALPAQGAGGGSAGQDPQQASGQEPKPTFTAAAAAVERRLEQSLAEYKALMQQIADEKIPLSRELNELRARRDEVRREYQDKSRTLDRSALDLNTLRTNIEARKNETAYVSNLLGEYINNFDARLHISEVARYEEAVKSAKLAAQNDNLTPSEVFEKQASLLETSLDRLEDALGGARFAGSAVGEDGLLKPGEFLLLGPAALFRAEDGSAVGTAEQKLGSLEPAILTFDDPEDTAAANSLLRGEGNIFPLDPTLGSAHQIAETQESLVEHIQKGGPVGYSIVVMAGLVLLIVVFKWVGLSTVPMPSRKKLDGLLAAVAARDEEAAQARAQKMRGPLGRMLRAGVANLRQPKDLIEESMYEQMLTTRLRLQRMLPFIAICAASAPLLGLLGTVTGIIETFKLITVFGTGDPKTLSSGISAALITTEMGLIVAIPSLLLHAYLSRKALGIIGRMETAAIAFVNEAGKAYPETLTATSSIGPGSGTGSEPERVRSQVKEILSEMLGPLANNGDGGRAAASGSA